MKIRISDIKIKDRIRKDLGDIQELKESINKLGLLQPIIIDIDNRLLAGQRRLEAVKQLGWEYVEVKIVDVTNKKQRLLIETDENIRRMSFNKSEIERGQILLRRHTYTGIFSRIWAWILDLIDRILT